MTNIKSIHQESNLIAALVVLCQDYILADEEFLANEKIQRNMKNTEFWIELAHGLNGSVTEHLRSKAGDQEGYDEYDSAAMPENVIINFILDPTNRFELNDIICESIESWLKHFGGKHFK